jgi:hypothetical protein
MSGLILTPCYGFTLNMDFPLFVTLRLHFRAFNEPYVDAHKILAPQNHGDKWGRPGTFLDKSEAPELQACFVNSNKE